MKKLVLLLTALIIATPAFAGGIGYINYEKVIMNYQYAKNSLTEIDNKGKEIQKYLETKEAEFNKLESAVQKKKLEDTVRTELKAKEKAFNVFREKREEDIYNKIHAVSEKIRLEKGYDAILDSRGVFSGGVDITDELVKKLNGN